MSAMNSSQLLALGQSHAAIKHAKRLTGWNNYHIEGNTVICKADRGSIAITFVSETLVRIRAWLGEYDSQQETGIVCSQNTEKPVTTAPVIKVEEPTDSILHIFANALEVFVNKTDFTLRILFEGRQIISDSSLFWNRKSFTISHTLGTEESVYGLGEKTGYLDKRGKTYEMWNTDVFAAHTATTDPLYVSIPFYVKLTNEYACGVYFDNSWRTRFDMGETNPDIAEVSAPAGNLDYYVIAGESLPSVLQQYTRLTGPSALPPRWAISHHQSRYSYKSEQEVLEITKGFTERNLECASIHLDIHYMEENRTFTWNEDTFPEPAEMSKKLAQEGIRLTAIVDPAIKVDPQYEIYREMVSSGFQCRYADGKPYIGKVWAGESLFPDFVREDVRLWWGEKVVTFMDTYGIEGIWHDMNEPAVFNDQSTMDVDVCHGDKTADSHARYHNLYAYYECMASFDAIRKSRGVRPFILTRAGFSGIQKYAAIWSGDNRSMWEHLELSLPMLLNMGMSGLPFVGADIGGFSFNSSPELLVRWYQLGMFYPFARNHCSEGARNQEPWSFGEKTEKDIVSSMRLRERLIPDFYTSFYHATTTAIPVMRGLAWDYPKDSVVRQIYDQFLFGNGLMGAPVLRPGVRIRQVYLPKGIWFNWHSGEKLEGDKWILADAPLEQMPLFIRAGSFLVTDEKEKNCISLTLWYDDSISSGTWNIYSDDGISFDHESGEYALDTLSWERTGNTVNLTQKTEGNTQLRNHSIIRLVIRNFPTCAEVTADGITVDSIVAQPENLASKTSITLDANFKRVLFQLS